MGGEDLLYSIFDSRNTLNSPNKSDECERHVRLPGLTVNSPYTVRYWLLYDLRNC